MDIQLTLNKDQFDSLLRVVYYAAMCSAGHDCEFRHELPQQIDAMTDLMLNKAVEMGYQGRDRDEALSNGEASALEKDLEDDEELQEVYGHHSENIFWDELVSHLVGRDLALKYGEQFELESIDQEEQDALYERYEREIAANGVRNLIFKTL